ncbi:Thioesterase/thiol ester dehydrase-isomerase, partial [Aureobasidium melanogenum]
MDEDNFLNGFAKDTFLSGNDIKNENFSFGPLSTEVSDTVNTIYCLPSGDRLPSGASPAAEKIGNVPEIWMNILSQADQVTLKAAIRVNKAWYTEDATITSERLLNIQSLRRLTHLHTWPTNNIGTTKCTVTAAELISLIEALQELVDLRIWLEFDFFRFEEAVEVAYDLPGRYPQFDDLENRRSYLAYLRKIAEAECMANAIGVKKNELHFLYELHPCFSAFPTFPINLAFKRTKQDVFDFLGDLGKTRIPGCPPLDPQRSVDGERGIEVVTPIPVSSEGLDLEVRNRCTGVWDKGGNLVVEHLAELVDAKTDKVYTRMSNAGVAMKQGGLGGPSGPKKVAVKVPTHEPDAISTFHTTEEVAMLYRLCGDYNLLHADDEFGKRAGFGGHILQGLGTWNIVAHEVLSHRLYARKPTNASQVMLHSSVTPNAKPSQVNTSSPTFGAMDPVSQPPDHFHACLVSPVLSASPRPLVEDDATSCWDDGILLLSELWGVSCANEHLLVNALAPCLKSVKVTIDADWEEYAIILRQLSKMHALEHLELTVWDVLLTGSVMLKFRTLTRLESFKVYTKGSYALTRCSATARGLAGMIQAMPSLGRFEILIDCEFMESQREWLCECWTGGTYFEHHSCRQQYLNYLHELAEDDHANAVAVSVTT